MSDIIKKGKMLRFIRPVIQDDIKYNTRSLPYSRSVYVLEDDSATGDGLVLLAFTRQLRNTAGNSVTMFSHDGFKYCRWVKKSILINNCKEVV